MSDLINELKYLKETKELIKEAIITKKGNIDGSTPFRDYAAEIRTLKNGNILNTASLAAMVGYGTNDNFIGNSYTLPLEMGELTSVTEKDATANTISINFTAPTYDCLAVLVVMHREEITSFSDTSGANWDFVGKSVSQAYESGWYQWLSVYKCKMSREEAKSGTIQFNFEGKDRLSIGLVFIADAKNIENVVNENIIINPYTPNLGDTSKNRFLIFLTAGQAPTSGSSPVFNMTYSGASEPLISQAVRTSMVYDYDFDSVVPTFSNISFSSKSGVCYAFKIIEEDS